MKNKIKDFLIKLLGGYRIIVGYFDSVDGCFKGSNTQIYPFQEHYLRLNGYTLYFDNKGRVKILPDKGN